MDYIYRRALQHSPLTDKVVSYDISCQWSVNLQERMENFPVDETDVPHAPIAYVIPKFHSHGHKDSCSDNYSLYYTPGCAQTDGEGIERVWWGFYRIGATLKELGPGCWSDTLDDLYSHWNWKKVTGLGTLILLPDVCD